MSIIRQQIKSMGLDASMRISIGSNDGFSGYQQEIDRLTSFTSIDLVNPTEDVEKRKFKLNPDTPVETMLFYFYRNSSYNFPSPPTFLKAGFTAEDIATNDISMQNSFFILDFYDTYNPNTQRKIFSTYLTKIGTAPEYKISGSTSNQLYYLYVPVWYINEFSGNTRIGYTKFSFYNAKSGITTLFYNYDNAINPLINLTPEKMYFKTELNRINRTWKFLNASHPTIRAYELINNPTYTQRINDTYAKTDNMQQTYPTGNTYNYQTNRYYDTE